MIRGVLSMALVAVIMTFQFLLVRFAVERISPTAVLLFQGAVVTIVAGALLIPRGIQAFKTDHPFLHLIRDIAALVGDLLYYLALSRLPLTEAVLLWTTFPLWVPILSRFTIKDRISLFTWFGIIIGFVGVAFVLHPDRSIDVLGLIFGLGAGLFAAVSIVIKKFLSHRDSSLLMLFYLGLVTLIGISPFAYITWKPLAWSPLLLVTSAACLFFAYQWLRAYSLQKAAVVLLSPIIYLTIIFSGFLDWIIWDNIPDGMWWIGASLIVIGGIGVIIFHHRQNSTQS